MENTEEAIFAGGCFWCLQYDFDHVDGVVSTSTGYCETCNIEVVKIIYNPGMISYEKLLDIYWHRIDPTRNDGQFYDVGEQYKPVIFYLNDKQKQLARASKKKTEQIITPVLVEIKKASLFHPAEDHHQ